MKLCETKLSVKIEVECGARRLETDGYRTSAICLEDEALNVQVSSWAPKYLFMSHKFLGDCLIFLLECTMGMKSGISFVTQPRFSL